MELCDYLDKGAALGGARPCLTMDAATLSYAGVQSLSHRIARSLHAGGIAPGSHVAVLSANDPLAFACVFGISRAGCTWVPINPRNAAAENGFVLDAFDCDALIVHPDFAAMAAALRPGLPKLKLTVGLDEFDRWLDPDDSPVVAPPPRLAMLPGTGGTTGSPKGVMLPASSIEAMSAAVLMRYPFVGRPTLPRDGTTDTCRRRHGVPLPGARRPRRGDAPARPRRLSRAGRAAPGDAQLPAADLDLHAARSPRPPRDRPLVAAMPVVRCRPRSRQRGSPRLATGSARWRRFSARPKRR